MKRIVVGLIDSPAARAALRWAVWQASTTGSLIEVVTCIRPLPCYVWSDLLLTSAPPLLTVGELRADAAVMQDRVLRQELGPLFGAVPIRASVVADEAAAGLARSAAGADLLAVGRSRRRRFLRRSIGDRCSMLYDGPVVLVPSEGRSSDRRVGVDTPALVQPHPEQIGA